MEEITLNKIEWSAPEYKHKERTNDWFWTVGLITVVCCVIAIWLKSYVFAIFLFISGCCLILFTIRHPQEISYSIETEGFQMGREKYIWKKVKGFDIKKGVEQSKLLIEIDKYFLPVYTIPLPNELVDEIKESLSKVSTKMELKESQSMQFAEKIGL